jgi:hypothetical protein
MLNKFGLFAFDGAAQRVLRLELCGLLALACRMQVRLFSIF